VTYPGAAAPSGGVAACFRHPDRGTGLACVRCGRPACPECLRDAAVGRQCVDCVAAGQRTGPPPAGPGAAQRRPYTTYALIAINVVVFAVTVVQAHSLADNRYAPLFLDWVLYPPLVAHGQIVRLVGSAFLHFGPIHLLLNMYCLYIVGRFIETVIGPARYLTLYLVSMLGGSAAVMLFSHDVATAGASGAIFGLFGVQAVILLRAKRSPTPVLVVIAINVVFSFSVPGISVWDHIGGLIAGTLAGTGMVFGPAWLGREGRTAKLVSWSAPVVIALVTFGVIAYEITRLRNALAIG